MSRREQLEELLKADPHDAFLQYALAMEHVSAGDTDAGLERLGQVIDEHPDYVAAYFQQGQLLAGQGRTDEARAILTSGIEAAGKVSDTHAAGEMSEFLATLST